DRRFARHPDGFAAIYTAAGRGRPPQLLFTSFSSTLGMIDVLLPFMALALYGVMRKIDPSYLRAAGLESDPVIAVVSTLLSGAVLIGVPIPLLLKHFRLTPSCPRLSAIVGYTPLSPLDNAELGHARVLAASTSLPRLRRGWGGGGPPRRGGGGASGLDP